MVMGAGVPLGFQLPTGLTVPSTSNITAEVCKEYYSIFQAGPVTIVNDMYHYLMSTLPAFIDPYAQSSQDAFPCDGDVFELCKVLEW